MESDFKSRNWCYEEKSINLLELGSLKERLTDESYYTCKSFEVDTNSFIFDLSLLHGITVHNKWEESVKVKINVHNN